MAEYAQVKNRVSVVTPVYNGQSHLHRLLDSILAQSWDSIEMILVDDGSQDGTLDVAWAYREKFQARGFPFHILSGEHQNAAAAISRGLPLVTGEFLVWPDSDDALERDSIRERVSFLRANPQYQCVRSLSRYRYEDGRTAPPQERRGDPDQESLFFPVLMGETFVCCGCYMLRCQAFFSIYPQRSIPIYDAGQNFQMLLPFLYRYPCPTLREELYTVYVRPDSHSRRPLDYFGAQKRGADFEAMLDELAALCGIQAPEELFRLELWKRRRRYRLNLQYGQRRKTASALFWLFSHGDMGVGELLKGICAILGGSRLYQLYCKLRYGQKGGS